MPRRKGTEAVLEELERRIANSAALTEQDKIEARERAREHVAKARKTKALDAYFAAAIREEERGFEPNDEMVDFTVNLPEYTPMLKINNVGYYHGCTYEVPQHVMVSMLDMQGRAWEHEGEWKEGRHRVGDAGRRPRHLMISPTNPTGR